MRSLSCLHRALVLGACCLLANESALAQQSVNKDLDSCIFKERATYTVAGAATGAAAAVVTDWFKKATAPPEKKNQPDNTAKHAAIGAVAGGVIGLIASYYTAVDNCYKKNPAWIPESNIKRTKSYNATVAELGYKPAMGILVRAKSVSMPATIRPGGTLEITSTFQVMTPNGSETEVTIERRLFGIAGGETKQLPFTGKGTEQRTVEPGEQTSVDHVPVPADVAVGAMFRVEYLVSVAGKPPSSASATVTVK